MVFNTDYFSLFYSSRVRFYGQFQLQRSNYGLQQTLYVSRAHQNNTNISILLIFANKRFTAEVKGFEWMSESNNEQIATFVNSWLPVTTIMLIMAALPYVFEWIGKKYEGRKTYSDIEESIARRYFLYQVRIIL